MPRFQDCWRCGNTVKVGIICGLCGIAKYCGIKCQKSDIFRHEAECIPASILRTCAMCRNSGGDLKACTGCYEVFYCNAKCQSNHWKRHKIDCEEVPKLLEKISGEIRMKFIVMPGLFPCPYYYWGNVPAFDCLNMIENEGKSYAMELNILYLGVGDLRNVALTCAYLPDAYTETVSFTLNDNSSCTLARLALLLYMLIKGDSGIECNVTEIWYSIQLSRSTYELLRKTLQELINIRTSLELRYETGGLLAIEDTMLKEFQNVWATWLSLKVEGAKWIQEQRKKWMTTVEFIERNNTYVNDVPKVHTNSAKQWIIDGVFKRTDTPLFAENPTLTGPDQKCRTREYSYSILPEVLPFSGWDYAQVKKFSYSDCIVTMFGNYIEFILRGFMRKLSSRQVTFLIVLYDCEQINRILDVGTVFDRILTSNLMDYIFLPRLLELCSGLINRHNHHATIVTETMTWTRYIMTKADIDSDKFKPQLQKLNKILQKDVGRSLKNPYCMRDYLENSFEFHVYLRSLFYAQSQMSNPSRKRGKVIPLLNELGKKMYLKLRDGIRNENRIVFFRPMTCRRKVTYLGGMERNLEWVPLR